jgi:hypothetical protein
LRTPTSQIHQIFQNRSIALPGDAGVNIGRPALYTREIIRPGRVSGSPEQFIMIRARVMMLASFGGSFLKYARLIVLGAKLLSLADGIMIEYLIMARFAG